jgi:hypothetical protein
LFVVAPPDDPCKATDLLLSFRLPELPSQQREITKKHTGVCELGNSRNYTSVVENYFLWTTKVLSDIVRFAAAVVFLSIFTPLHIYMQKNFIFLQ